MRREHLRDRPNIVIRAEDEHVPVEAYEIAEKIVPDQKQNICDGYVGSTAHPVSVDVELTKVSVSMYDTRSMCPYCASKQKRRTA